MICSEIKIQLLKVIVSLIFFFICIYNLYIWHQNQLELSARVSIIPFPNGQKKVSFRIPDKCTDVDPQKNLSGFGFELYVICHTQINAAQLHYILSINISA